MEYKERVLEIPECYISVNDLRPLYNAEDAKCLHDVERDKNSAKYGEAHLLRAVLLIIAAKSNDEQDNAAQKSASTEQTAPIKPDEHDERANEILKPFKLVSFLLSVPAVMFGKMITFAASTSGGAESLVYIFRVFKDGKQITSNAMQNARRFIHTPEETGTYYARVTIDTTAQD